MIDHRDSMHYPPFAHSVQRLKIDLIVLIGFKHILGDTLNNPLLSLFIALLYCLYLSRVLDCCTCSKDMESPSRPS